jgi:hypothetical protein
MMGGDTSAVNGAYADRALACAERGSSTPLTPCPLSARERGMQRDGVQRIEALAEEEFEAHC